MSIPIESVKLYISMYNVHIHLQILKGDSSPSVSINMMNLWSAQDKSIKPSLLCCSITSRKASRSGDLCTRSSGYAQGVVLASEGHGANEAKLLPSKHPLWKRYPRHSPCEISGEKLMNIGHKSRKSIAATWTLQNSTKIFPTIW